MNIKKNFSFSVLAIFLFLSNAFASNMSNVNFLTYIARSGVYAETLEMLMNQINQFHNGNERAFSREEAIEFVDFVNNPHKNFSQAKLMPLLNDYTLKNIFYLLLEEDTRKLQEMYGANFIAKTSLLYAELYHFVYNEIKEKNPNHDVIQSKELEVKVDLRTVYDMFYIFNTIDYSDKDYEKILMASFGAFRESFDSVIGYYKDAALSVGVLENFVKHFLLLLEGKMMNMTPDRKSFLANPKFHAFLLKNSSRDIGESLIRMSVARQCEYNFEKVTKNLDI